MKIDPTDSFFIKTLGFVVSVVSFGAISAHKITEHGREIKRIKEKIDPLDNKHRLMTAEDVADQLHICSLNHQATTENIFRDINDIKRTLREGEKLRNKARSEREHHLEQLTLAIVSLEKKIG